MTCTRTVMSTFFQTVIMSSAEDSDPDLTDVNDFRCGAKLIYDKDKPFVALQPPGVIYERWNKIPVDQKKLACQLMHVVSFWYRIILVRQDSHHTTRWAVEMGFIDSNSNNDLTLRRLQKIETLQAILRAMENGCLKDNQTRHMIWISNKFNLHADDVLDDAMAWLERSGEPQIRQRIEELGNGGITYTLLQKVFSEYAHYTQAMGVDKKKMMRELQKGPSQFDIDKSDEMKVKGNDQFQKKKYDSAVKSYSRAIKHNPENHVIYGNRALCYIRSEKYLKAVADGKRATLIKPTWAKGHYRYCEALYYLGEHRQAIDSNVLAQTLCKADEEGMKDLQQQYAKFSIETEDTKKDNLSWRDEPALAIRKSHLTYNWNAGHVQESTSEWVSPPNASQVVQTIQPEIVPFDDPIAQKFMRDDSPEPCREIVIRRPGEEQPHIIISPTQYNEKGQGYTAISGSILNSGTSIKVGLVKSIETGETSVYTHTTEHGHEIHPIPKPNQPHRHHKAIAMPEPPPKSNRLPSKDRKNAVKDKVEKTGGYTGKDKVEKISPSPSKPVRDRSVPVRDRSVPPPKPVTPSPARESERRPSKDSERQAKQSAVPPSPAKELAPSTETERPKVVKPVVVPVVYGERHALKSLVEDAHSALTDLRCRNAQQSFSQALTILTNNSLKDLGITQLDHIVLIYGHAMALLEIGQPEELAEAEKEFDKIKAYEERKFQCLVFYGIGKVYLKWNRFSTALEQFSDSMQMVKKQITPGKLTWPHTKDIVKETDPDYFKELLHHSMELCRFPPRPDAICRQPNCLGHSKIEIFFTDPDFKGFIRMVCCQNCIVEYHISCWKTLKTASFSDKSEKDFLQEMCFTPDCVGRICRITIYGSTGLVKCKFESSVTNPSDRPVKLKVNQKATGLKKLKSKEDRKLRRKQYRQEAIEKAETIETAGSEIIDTGAVIVSQEKALSPTWLLYKDRVLLQLSEIRNLFQDEKGPDVGALMKALGPWMELDVQKGNKPVGLAQTLAEVVEILLERKNRVWARVFISSLSTMDASPRLHDWAFQLDKAGLNAASMFVDRYAEHLESLDLSPLLLFPPLQDMLIERFGTRPEFFSRMGLSVTEYLKQAPPREMRLFIWTLEENRERYASCHGLLDDYFEMMDGVCVVIRKSENEISSNSPIKTTKNKNRKKKQKEPKTVIHLGVKSTREEEEEDLLEDDSLTFLDPSEPFTVPNRLRDQVAEFEDQYNGTSQTRYKRILDNNPDPTTESLYDYFAQILEQHGPLPPQDPLLVGELVNFPDDAQKKIETAGGLQNFLLGSLRFAVTAGNLIGLMRHAPQGDGLDDLDVIGGNNTLAIPNLTPPTTNNISPSSSVNDFSAGSHVNGTMPVVPAYTSYPAADRYGYPSNAEIQPVLTHHASQPDVSHDALVSQLNGVASEGITTSATQPEAEEFFDCDDIDLYLGENDENGVWKTTVETKRNGSLVEPGTTSGNNLLEPAESQATTDSDRHYSNVAINTEPYQPYETNNGDMMKSEKDNVEFEKQIKQIQEEYVTVKLKRQEACNVLLAELATTNTNIGITNKELSMFQQKLEEEVKKDQQEKRDNQETLKALKSEIKDLAESQEGLSKDIREKNKTYETLLNDFCELSNQSAAQKMSLEDEIKRCKDLNSKAAKRTLSAELSILESTAGRGLRSLYTARSEARMILTKMADLANRYPPHVLHASLDAWSNCAQGIEEKIKATESQFHDQMEQLRRGTRLSALPTVVIPEIPQLPPVPLLYPLAPHQHLARHPPPPHPSYGGPIPVRGPLLLHPTAPVPDEQPGRAASQSPSSGGGAPASNHVYSQGSAVQRPAQVQGPAVQRPAPVQAPVAQRNQSPSQIFVEKILDGLTAMFPHYRRPVLLAFVQEVRNANGGKFNNQSYEQAINEVAQSILDHQDAKEQMSGKGDSLGGGDQAGSNRTSTPPLAPWIKSNGAHGRGSSKALHIEDPCIICHEDMSKEDLCVLECRHSFHKECIRSWLKEQSTCPTCREHALLPEDFPMLPGRIRRGHAHTAFS